MSNPYLWCVAVLTGALACSSGPGTNKVGQQPSWRTNPGPVQSRSFSGSGGSEGSPGQSSNPSSSRPAASSGKTGTTGDKQSEPALQPLVFKPKGTAASMYNAEHVGRIPASALENAALATINDVCQQLGIAPPQPDARLYRAADDIAAVVPEEEPLSYALIEFSMQRHGIIEPSPHMLPVAGTLTEHGPILEQLAERLPRILAQDPVTRLGIGTAPGSGPGRDLLVLLLQASHVETKPIPREVAKNDSFVVEGKALADYREVEIFVTREDGVVVRHDLKRRGDQGFQATLSCIGRSGRQQVEITAENARGSTVLANFPVWCGSKAPTGLTVQPSIDDLMPVKTVAEAESLMLQLVNRDRKRNGLPPLSLSTELSAVARGHSEGMRDSGVVAHTSTTTGTAQDRVRAAGIRTSLVMENIARAYGVGEAQDGLMNSPGHRSNLLSDKATHIGIGIALLETPSEGRIMFFTQLFMRVPPVLSARQAYKALNARIGKEKGHVTERPELSSVAQEYADKVIAPGMPERAASAWRAAQMHGLRQHYGRVATAVVAVLDLDSIDMDDAFSDAWIRFYGLGVAKGVHPQLGKDTLYIVLVLAEAP